MQLHQTVGDFVTVVKWCTLLVGFGCYCLVSFHVVLSLRCALGVPRLCVFICTGETLHLCNFALKLRFCLWCVSGGCECCFFHQFDFHALWSVLLGFVIVLLLVVTGYGECCRYIASCICSKTLVYGSLAAGLM